MTDEWNIRFTRQYFTYRSCYDSKWLLTIYRRELLIFISHFAYPKMFHPMFCNQNQRLAVERESVWNWMFSLQLSTIDHQCQRSFPIATYPSWWLNLVPHLTIHSISMTLDIAGKMKSVMEIYWNFWTYSQCLYLINLNWSLAEIGTLPMSCIGHWKMVRMENTNEWATHKI